MTKKKNKQLYLAQFEFICGEYGQPFNLIFHASSRDDLEEQIHNYLSGYYGEENMFKKEGDTYFYNNGEVAVKKFGWQKIRNYQQIVKSLSA